MKKEEERRKKEEGRRKKEEGEEGERCDHSVNVVNMAGVRYQISNVKYQYSV